MSTGNTYIVLGEQLLSEVDDLGLLRLLCRLEPKSETQHGRSATEAARWREQKKKPLRDFLEKNLNLTNMHSRY